MKYLELAEKLNGCERGDEMDSDWGQIAKMHGLVVVFGASDDLCEFRGAIDDEIGCYEGRDIYIGKNGLFATPDNCDCDNVEDCPLLEKELKENYSLIKAVWCEGDDNGEHIPWTYETEIPHSTFDVMEDGELYCRGIVFSVEDLK